MKKYLVPVTIIIMAISMGFNVYYFGYKKIGEIYYQRGFNDGVNAVSNNIVSQYKAEGKLSMVLDGEQLVLVPQETSIVSDDIENYFQ